MKYPVNPRTAEELYQNLGKLFYAVAAADNVVRKEEVNTLKRIVEEEWLKFDDFQDEFGADEAYQIEIIFDWLDANNPDANQAFEEFKEFKEEHENFFEPEMKKLIWQTAEEIATSFAGKNKSEVIMLSRLKAIL